jgi:hypothetical protein
VHRVVLSLVLFHAVLGFSQAPETSATRGKVLGKVLNEQGQPVVGAKVFLTLSDNAPHIGGIRHSLTDGDGLFSIPDLAFAVYRVDTEAETEGFAHTYWAFYTAGLPPVTVALTSKAPVADLVLIVGPKAGMITGSISDAVTGNPLHANFHLWRIKDSHSSLEQSAPSEFQVLIPPNVEVGISVQAPGYHEWYYPGTPDAASLASHLVLRSGQKMAIDVRLLPNAP